MSDIIEINTYETVENIEISVFPTYNEININRVNQTGLVNSVNGQIGDVIIETNEQVNSDWNATSGVAQILNKPTIPNTANLVPYSGATQNVNLGEFGAKTGHLEFDTTPTNAPTTVGSLVWNDADGTLDLKLKGGAVTLQIGQETLARIVNKTSTNITLLETNYQAVRITGAQGQRPKVDLAQANNDLNSASTLGLVTETILNNKEGFVTTSGQVREINTTGSLQGETWADGDVLYLSGTIAGRITNIKPFAPIHTIIIGFVEHAHAVHGKIFVKIDNGYELQELHNVDAVSPNNNEVLMYEASALLWKPKALTTAEIADSTGKRYQTESQKTFNDATSSIQTQLNSKQDALSGTGLVKSTAGVISYDNSNFVKSLILDSTAINITGVTGITLMSSYLIPANTIKSTNKVMKLESVMVTRVGGTGAWGFKLYVNSAENLTGASPLTGTIALVSTQVFGNIQRTYYLGGSNLRSLNISAAVFTDFTSSPSAMTTQPFDITVDNYILVTIIPTISTDVFTQQGINLTIQ